jgi:hypothetical protein
MCTAWGELYEKQKTVNSLEEKEKKRVGKLPHPHGRGFGVSSGLHDAPSFPPSGCLLTPDPYLSLRHRLCSLIQVTVVLEATLRTPQLPSFNVGNIPTLVTGAFRERPQSF